MTEQHLFKWRHFQSDIILLGVRWYARYPLSYRDLEEMMLERSLHVDHTTIDRWVQQYAPELERRCRSYLKPETDSWRVDETYIKVKKAWVSLYRAVDSQRNTLDFWFSPTRKAEAAKRFFLKTLRATSCSSSFLHNFCNTTLSRDACERTKNAWERALAMVSASRRGRPISTLKTSRSLQLIADR